MKTHYKTIDFTNKLEAQWAVFFDDLETAWEYESRSFRFPDITYTPTFFIPGWKCFVSIRTAVPTDRELEAAGEVMRETGMKFFFFLREPDNNWEVLQVDFSNGELILATGKMYEDRRVPDGIVWCGHKNFEGWMTGIYCPPEGNKNDFCEKYPGGLGIVQAALTAAQNAF